MTSANAVAESPTKPQSNVTPNNDPNSVDAPYWRKEAWQRLTADGRYRIARADEFNIPEAAKRDKYTRIDIEDATAHPFVTLDANHDNRFQDLAVIVIDVTRDGQDRFGIVIFNEPADGKSIPSPSWLYQERDLSRTMLSAWSGGLAIRDYREDGTYNLCYVNWDQQQQRYSCSQQYKH